MDILIKCPSHLLRNDESIIHHSQKINFLINAGGCWSAPQVIYITKPLLQGENSVLTSPIPMGSHLWGVSLSPTDTSSLKAAPLAFYTEQNIFRLIFQNSKENENVTLHCEALCLPDVTGLYDAKTL